MPFQLVGLDFAPFAPLFELPDEVLRERNMRRVIADSKPGYPCRVSLEDAEIGEELLLVPFAHLDAASPYRSSGPIFVRRAARGAHLGVGAVPDYVRLRQMSVRGYDADSLMIAAAVCEGDEVASTLEQMFANTAVDYIHLHNAKRGCFSCRVNRIEGSAAS